jgi:hypothetical protein
MSSVIALPFRPVLNQQNGSFESGATMTVYKQGTTTLEPLYENEERTIPLPNPITADGYGVFPPIYWNDAQPIRVLIQESNGTNLFDIDPYISTVFDAEAILDQAAAQTAVAAGHASAAQISATNAAGSEAAAEALIGPSYASTAAGIAATSNGEFFAVVAGDVVEIYLNNAGTPVLQRSILSATATQTALNGKANTVHTHVIADVPGLQTELNNRAPLANPEFTGTPTVGGIEIGYRGIPRRTTTTTAVAADRGGCVALGANITIPASVFAAGDAVSFYNNTAGSLTLTQGSGLTLRQAGTSNTGNRTLALRGMATVWFNSPTEAIVSGPGVT